MELYIITAATFLAGIYFISRNILMMRDEKRLIAYLETSPKGKAWVARYGMENTIKKCKKVFLPLGCVIGCVLFAVGARNILIILNIF